MTKLTAEEFAALEPILWKRTTSDHLLLRAMEEVVRLRSLRSKDGTEAEREMLADEFEKLPVHLWGRCTGCGKDDNCATRCPMPMIAACDTIERLRKELGEAVALVRRDQWPSYFGGYTSCGECEAEERLKAHKDDCLIGKLLARHPEKP